MVFDSVRDHTDTGIIAKVAPNYGQDPELLPYARRIRVQLGDTRLLEYVNGTQLRRR